MIYRHLYNIFLHIVLPLAILRLFWKSLRNRRYRERIAERLARFDITFEDDVIWIHAVSVGELNAAMPLVQFFLEHFKQYRILITTVTPTAAKRVEQLFGDKITHLYAPYDLNVVVNRFLKKVKPIVAIVMETEIWPNLFEACAKNNIPLLIVNARLSKKSAKRYAWIKKLIVPCLNNASHIAVQTIEDRTRFINLGVDEEKLSIMGNLKFEVRLPDDIREVAEALRKRWGMTKMIFLAASTHAGEEELMIRAYKQVRQHLPNVLLVLAPRHPERAKNIEKLCLKQKLNVVKKTDSEYGALSMDCFIVDTIGDLPLYYAISDIAFVGGSFATIGGHNVLEPAALGKPIIVGPHIENFAQVTHMLQEKGALTIIKNSHYLGNVVRSLLENPDHRDVMGVAGRKFVFNSRGALKRILAVLIPYITQNHSKN